MIRFSNDNSVLITGAGGGIGSASARLFASLGARVVLAGVPADGVVVVAEQIKQSGGQAMGVGCDVSDAGEVERAFRKGVEAFGRIDAVIANAGVQLHRQDHTLHEMDDDAWDRTQDVNFRGVYLTCKHALRTFIQGERGGSITIVSSIAGLSGAAAYPAYTSGKHGIIGLGRYIATHYARHGVRCNVLCPGALVTTPNHDQLPDPESRKASRLARIPLGRLGTPDDIAPWLVFLASEQSAYTTGAVIPVDGGFDAC